MLANIMLTRFLQLSHRILLLYLVLTTDLYYIPTLSIILSHDIIQVGYKNHLLQCSD